MTRPITSQDPKLWTDLVDARTSLMLASRRFFAEGVDRAPFLSAALRKPGEDRSTAIYFLRYLKPKEVREIFPELLFLASFAHGAIQPVRDAILSLPRDWVLSQIEGVAEPLLSEGTYDEYRRFLELYNELDHDLTARLAHRAAEHQDEDIREAGEDFLNILRSKASPRAAIIIPHPVSSPTNDSLHQEKIG